MNSSQNRGYTTISNDSAGHNGTASAAASASNCTMPEIIPTSVNDTESEQQLKKSLEAVNLQNAPTPEQSWQLPHEMLEEGSNSQSMTEEMNRLQVLRSYVILDSAREQRFERITALVGRIFDVPIALVSLVDLGRQWFMSNRGLGDVRETPRKHAFCAHAILSTQDLLVVGDAKLDDRFKSNPLVTGEPFIRFYAGAPLISPEGYKLGTLCIIDVKPRPQGLSLHEKQNLREMAALVMDTMVERRNERLRQSKSARSVEIACTAHDLLTPLSGVQLSLCLLQDDGELLSRMDEHQKELLQTASNCSDVMSRICHDTIEGFRNDISKEGSSKNNDVNGIDQGKEGYLVVANLVENLSKVMDPYPKRVPLTIAVDESVPPVVVADDLKVFRATLNYLTNACKHTDNGSVTFRILSRERKSGMKELVFEVEDTGPGIDIELYSKLFVPFTEDSTQQGKGQVYADMTNSGLGLFSVASILSSIGGDYGYKPRPAPMTTEYSSTCGSQPPTRGSIFWFSFPLIVPENMEEIVAQYNAKCERVRSLESVTNSVNNIIESSKQNVYTSENAKNEEFHLKSLNAITRKAAKTMDDKTPAKKKRKILSTVGLSSSECDEICKGLSQPLVATSHVSAKSSSEGYIEKSTKRTRHALVIDDSVTIRKSIERALVKMGFAVSLACNGMEGLKMLQKSLFDVVLCDFLMPIMDGLDCVQQYRSWENRNRPWFRQVIIGISAHASQQDAARGADVGMDRFISKPLPLKTLKNLVTLPEVTRASKALDQKFENAAQDSSGGNLMLPPDLQLPKKTSNNNVNREEDTDNNSTVSSISGGMSDNYSSGLVCLIAEDSRSVARLLVRAVEARGWRASVVDNGEAALRLLKMRNWDAVFLDDQMPMLSGTSCMSRFRLWEVQNRVARQNNIFLVSSNALPLEKGTVKTANPAGFDGCLGKPIQNEPLSKLLDQASVKKKSQILTR